VIRSFRDKALERFFATGDGRRLSVQNTRSCLHLGDSHRLATVIQDRN
jgi:hypothetical protein